MFGICIADVGEKDRYQSITDLLVSMKSLAAEYGLTSGGQYEPRRKLRMFYLVYKDEDRKELKTAMDEFNLKVQRIGVELKAGDLIDI
jgi:hypothetical protein